VVVVEQGEVSGVMSEEVSVAEIEAVSVVTSEADVENLSLEGRTEAIEAALITSIAVEAGGAVEVMIVELV